MKIGIVTTWFERGAAYVSKQYEQLLEEDHEVFIYARGGEKYAIGDPKWDKKNVWWGKKTFMPITGTYIDEKDFKNWLAVNQIETVLFNEQSWWQTIVTCKTMGIKTGAYIDYYTDRTLELFKIYDFLICNTKRHYSAFSWHPQCYYIPWGTDIDLFAPKEFEANKRSKITFFHSAGMSPFRKGTDFVIKAFKKIADTSSDSHLIIHTQTNLEKSFPSLAETINELVLKKRLMIIEKTVSAPGLYHLGDIYVYPSRLEGIGLSITEALSCGLPTITVDNAPMNEFINEPSSVVPVRKYYCRSDGYYWPICEVNIDLLTEKMKDFLIHKDNISEYKNKTRQYAINKLNWKNNKHSVKSVFEKSKILPVERDIIDKINKYDNSKFPFITKYPNLYNLGYRAFKFLKETVV